MRKVFQAELDQIGAGLTEIAGLVTEAMEQSVRAFQHADVELAQDVIAAEPGSTSCRTAWMGAPSTSWPGRARWQPTSR